MARVTASYNRVNRARRNILCLKVRKSGNRVRIQFVIRIILTLILIGVIIFYSSAGFFLCWLYYRFITSSISCQSICWRRRKRSMWKTSRMNGVTSKHPSMEITAFKLLSDSSIKWLYEYYASLPTAARHSKGFDC